jgi:hypothetical protein
MAKEKNQITQDPARTESTVGRVKHRSVSEADLDQAAPSGESDIDPGNSKSGSKGSSSEQD